ncbi:MAG: iron-sulfur cluster assembly scaffold protein [Nanoarchaeota archaeon]
MELLFEELMEHYKEPRNFGSLENFDIKQFDSNPLCGDEVEITCKIDKDKIKEIKFTGEGCAISKSAASILTEYVRGKNLKEVIELSNERFLNLYGFKPSPMRIKCALLALITLKKGVVKYVGRENK